MNPKKTKTLPEDQRGAWFDGPDIVTSLRVHGTGLVFDLARDRSTFTLGSNSTADIAVASDHLSGLHCVLERRGLKLRVQDQGSYNGTHFNERRESTFDLQPGDTFVAASIRFLAQNDEMRSAHSTLVELLGAEDEHVLASPEAAWARPSDVLVAAAHSSNIVIAGEKGCDHLRLARAIHRVSLRRNRPIVEIERVPEERSQQRAIIDAATRSTLVITVDDDASVVDAAFASMIFSAPFHIRVIALATASETVGKVLGHSYAAPMRLIQLLPIARRRGMISRLLDQLLSERDAPFRVSDLTAKNQEALQTYEWPENFDDLRFAADALIAMHRGGSIRGTADILGIKKSTWHYWMAAVGLSKPLTAHG